MSCIVQIVHNVHTVPNSYRKVTTKFIIVHTNIYHKPSLPLSLTLTLVTKSTGTWSVRVRWTVSPSAWRLCRLSRGSVLELRGAKFLVPLVHVVVVVVLVPYSCLARGT